MDTRTKGMSDIPKFVACCVDDEECIHFYGTGDTEDKAVDEFIKKGQFIDYCSEWLFEEGEEVLVFVYTAVHPNDSDWEPEDIEEYGWEWCLDKLVETRTVKYQKEPPQ